MSVKSFTGKFYSTTITAGSTSFSGLSQIAIRWSKPTSLYKPLDYSAPIRVKGKLQGTLQLKGMAVTASDFQHLTANLPAVTIAGTTPTRSTITLNNGTASVTYTGYDTGTRGFEFRQIAERTWVLDKTVSYFLTEGA